MRIGVSKQRIKIKMQSTDLDVAIKDSLRSFYQGISSPNWCSREREMVSLFALGHLARHCAPGGLLCLTQIGIEVAVRQLPRCESHPGRKGTVCKDLVIWSAPNMTLWNSERQVHYEPLAVMEWKVNYCLETERGCVKPDNRPKHSSDIEWLKEKSSSVVDFIGYAVFIEGTLTPKELVCARMQNGNSDLRWFVLPE